MNIKLVIAVAFVALLLVLVLFFTVYPLGLIGHVEGEILDIEYPSTYSEPGTYPIKVAIQNTEPYSGYLYVFLIDNKNTGACRECTCATTKAFFIPLQDLVMIVNLEIPNGYTEVGEDYLGKLIVSHDPDNEIFPGGQDCSLDDDLEIISIEYSINHAPSIGEVTVSPNSGIEVDDPVNFYCSVYDADGDSVDVKWSFGDGEMSDWGPNSVIHYYGSEGIYKVKVQPIDSKGLVGTWSDTITVEVTDGTVGTYSLILNIKDKDTNDPIEGASVKIGSTILHSDTTGKVAFSSLVPNTYSFEVTKEGYNSYNSYATIVDKDVSVNVLLTLGTELSIDILPLSVSIIIFSAFTIVSLAVPIFRAFAVIGISVGAIIAIVCYLFLGGIVTI